MRPNRLRGLLLGILLCSGGFALPACAQPSTGPVVTISGGKLQGTRTAEIHAFKGIRYAEPPLGERRWAPPVPAKPWTDVRSAKDYGSACIQKPGLSAANGGDPGPLSEDCLFLNVWTPALDPAAKLPVIVWIHGGAYIFGAGGLPLYDGTPMAEKGAVFVSLNYRLGPLGFFAHPALENSSHGKTYNFGLLDQVTALTWVRENIAQFGGDPSNVTLMGQSAGAKSVIAHFASPLSRTLFKRGVALSVYILPDAKPAKARDVASRIASAVGLKGADASLHDLRKVPAERFGDIADPAAALGPVPIAGDAVLPRSISDTFAAGAEAPYPLLMTSTSDDASVIAEFGYDPAALVKKLGAARFALKVLYPGVKDEAELGRQALRDVVFTMTPRWVSDRHAKRGRTYRGYFDYTAQNNRAKFPNGVPHGGDIPYILDTTHIFEELKDVVTPADRAYARQASSYIFAFARTGVPNAAGVLGWEDDRPLRDRTLRFAPALRAHALRPG